MAHEHNALTYAPEVSLAIRRMFGGDQDLVVERLSETLQPVIDVWGDPDRAWLREEFLFADVTTSPAVVANVSYAAIVNPAAARRIVVIERAGCRSAAAGVADLFVLPATAITPITTFTTFKRDTRIQNAAAQQALPVTMVEGRTGDNLAGLLANVADEVFTSTTEIRDFKMLPVVLSPGFGLVMEFQTANTALVALWAGRVRNARAGELP